MCALEVRTLAGLALLLLVCGQRAVARPDTTAHARVELIAADDSIAPGGSVRAGLRFELDPQWHIYWKNPGDSGEPPRVKWELPAGFRAGEIEWPVPIPLGKPPIVDYGYEGLVLLTVPIRAPSNLKTGTTMTLGAQVNWVVCSDICIPGKAHLTLSLPVRQGNAKQDSHWRPLFERTRTAVPRQAPTNWKVRVVSEKYSFTLTIATGTREQKATFFPSQPQQIENAGEQVATPYDRGIRLRLQKSGQLVRVPGVLKGVVVLGDGRAFEVAAPVSAPLKPSGAGANPNNQAE